MNIKQLYDERSSEKGRYPFLEAVETAGVEVTLDALGFPKERSGIWYNIYTGSEEMLGDMLSHSFGHDIPPEGEAEELGSILEHWLPKIEDPNPVISRSLALTEGAVVEQIAEHLQNYAVEAETSDSFVDRVSDMGGTLPDGRYICSPRTRGKVHVFLHDDRVFEFGLRSIYQFIKQREEQPSLF